ncbi:MAG TPA: hypothetical protein VHU83_24785 [Bryobacteraceae bacterium]|nr:hypothetical protein [Bryobacteraceae bacterium]
MSFTVPATVPTGSGLNSVVISGLSFPVTAAAFNVYRGTTPQLLYRIATNQPLNASYMDTGAAPQPIGPPDASFDHANFYYRFEYAGPYPATIVSSTTIGWADMAATASAYKGMVVRIIEGTGRSQERTITANDQTTLTVTPAWSISPDATSTFVIAESSWRFAAVSATSPAQFQVAYETGSVVQISGRGANVSNQEGTPDLCPLTRWTLGGQSSDAGLPGIPEFTLSAPGGGELALSQVGFTDLTNTSSVSSGTLQLFSWNELNTPSAYSLAASVDISSTTVSLVVIASPTTGQTIQIGAELMTVLSADPVANTYTVIRAVLGSAATAHSTGDLVLHLDATAVVVAFATGFFENRASLNYLHTVSLPDVRLCAAEFFVTNAFGNSQVQQTCYTLQPDGGLRTLSGGQFSLQVSGYLATQQNASPPLLIEASHAVRDIRAVVNQAATGYTISVDILQNGTEYCNVSIASGQTTSTVLDGAALPALQNTAALTINVTLQVVSGYSGQISPGRDLAVTIRL